MRLFGWIVTLSVSVLFCQTLGAAPKEKLIVVNRPTVVAFFPPVTDAELTKDPDTNESLADFQLYATSVRAQGLSSKRFMHRRSLFGAGQRQRPFAPRRRRLGITSSHQEEHHESNT